jgi:hypothetical protein
MKTKTIFQICFTLLLSGILFSCDKDDDVSYTLEDKTVTGDFAYTTKSFIPIAVDPVTMQPLSANISMEGSGLVTDLGTMTFSTSFKFDFVAGKGSDFATTYYGANTADSFTATGSSQQQQDGSITLWETFSNGKGKFARMKGTGTTRVVIFPDQSGGTGEVSWKVTY